MIGSVLMVCEGNVCRSPVARVMLQKELPHLVVSSAGTRALVGERADPLAMQLASEHGLDISDHVATALTREDVCAAELILSMTQVQRELIVTTYPFARGKVFRLGEHDQIDIVDPYRRHRAAFDLAFAQIEHGISNWRDVIARLAH
ncbi:low molecular weight protein-tyrosine-phosphatase [Paraburkholderia fungorum]|uniref:low molecular weight protein-tyrosine-phosphatase n=1 Tax=Paraburkholderia fungorum TaxID=134537 RepID=UPI001C1EA77A|nr:low molecular weight protein-tyrosine-phosphatase [Paraburkholderia fungorum]MBU7442009.1 low molecular weight phosphotyrosine protein phosphatase [Paraburkholderia fungorum]